MTVIKLPDPFIPTYYVPTAKLVHEKFREHFTPNQIDEMSFPVVIAMDDVPQWVRAREYMDSMANRLRMMSEAVTISAIGYHMKLKTLAGMIVVQLTHSEYALLEKMLDGQKYAPKELIAALQAASPTPGKDYGSKGNSILHVFLMRIRKKIKAAGGYSACIETIRGVGYRYIGGDNITLHTGKIE